MINHLYFMFKTRKCNAKSDEKNVIVGPQNDCNLFGRLYIASQLRGEDIDDFSLTKILLGHYEYQKYFVFMLTYISIML